MPNNSNSQLTKQVFSRIARILKEKNIDFEHAFNRFDTNKD